MLAAAFLFYGGVKGSPLLGLFLVIAVLFAFPAVIAAAVALFLFAAEREFHPALVSARVCVAGVWFGVAGFGTAMLYQTSRFYGGIAVLVASLACCLSFLRLMG